MFANFHPTCLQLSAVHEWCSCMLSATLPTILFVRGAVPGQIQYWHLRQFRIPCLRAAALPPFTCLDAASMRCGRLWSEAASHINMIGLEAQHLVTNLMKKGHRAGIIPHPSKAPPQPHFCCRRWQMIRVAELLAIEDVACSGHAAVIRQFTLSDWQSHRGPPQGSGLAHVNGKGASRFACGCTSCYRDIWIRKHAWYR